MHSVVLNNGKTVAVHIPPLYRIQDLVERAHPRPRPPVRTAETVGGGQVSMVIEDDPEYKEALKRYDIDFGAWVREATLLFALKDEPVPSGFDVEEYREVVSFIDPEWEPRKGAAGRKLDYIEFVLLASPADELAVQTAINEAISIDDREVAKIAESFPG